MKVFIKLLLVLLVSVLNSGCVIMSDLLPVREFETIYFKIIESNSFIKPEFISNNAVLARGEFRGEESLFWIEYPVGENEIHPKLKERNFQKLGDSHQIKSWSRSIYNRGFGMKKVFQKGLFWNTEILIF